MRARAVRFVAPRVVEAGRVEVREPGEGELLVRAACSGISGGTELLAARGELDPGPLHIVARGNRGQLVFVQQDDVDGFLALLADVVMRGLALSRLLPHAEPLPPRRRHARCERLRHHAPAERLVPRSGSTGATPSPAISSKTGSTQTRSRAPRTFSSLRGTSC